MQKRKMQDKKEANYPDSSVDANDHSKLTMDDDTKSVHCLIKENLSRDLFLGEYTEKRYVASLNEYRDIVMIDYTEEQIIQSLKRIRKLAIDNYGAQKWIGITNDDNGRDSNFYLWVKLEKPIFGRYWFKVQSVHIENNEIFLQLKTVRPFGPCKNSSTLDMSGFDISKVLDFENICTLLKFGFVSVVFIITCAFNAVPHVAEFILKLVRELSHLIRAVTPLVLGIYELCARCIGGFYWMIIMLIKSPKQIPMNTLNTNPAYSTRPLPNRRNFDLEWKTARNYQYQK